MTVKQVLMSVGMVAFLTGCGGWDTRPSPMSSAGLKDGLIVSAAVAAGKAVYNAADSSLDELAENRRVAKQNELAAATGLRRAELEAEMDQLRSEQPVGCLTAGEPSYQSKLGCLKGGGQPSSDLVAECKYPDGGVQLIMLDDCLRFLSAEVLAVYDRSTKLEVLVDSQIVRKLNN